MEHKMTELKPCPFCGEVPKITGDPDSEEYIRGYSMGFVECRNDSCPMSYNFIIAPTQKEATSLWNNRPIEEILQARIIALEKELDAKDKTINELIEAKNRLYDAWQKELWGEDA